MRPPLFSPEQAHERVRQLHAEAATARLLRARPSWRLRLAASLVRWALRWEPELTQHLARPSRSP